MSSISEVSSPAETHASEQAAKMLKLSTGMLLMLFFACCSLYGQGGALVSGIVVMGPTGKPLAGATVTVCAYPGIGVPCTNTINIFNDPALTQPKGNPGTTDGLGNFVAFASPGPYS
jgi:hypothetical protein